MQFESIVIRVFDVDFMLFDLVLAGLWILLLYKKRLVIPLVFGLFGILVNFIVDYCYWYSILGIRTVEGLPIWMSPLGFFVYFSITYGMIQYSYVQVMFMRRPDQPRTERGNRIKWSLFLFSGWLAIGLLSNIFPINDSKVTVARVMTDQRITEVYAVIAEYALLALLALKNKFELSPRRILYIFLVGIFVHFSMEITLFLAGMRASSVFDIIFNSVFEFNTGAPILYLMMFVLIPYIEKHKMRSPQGFPIESSTD
ncbi:MAG: hypothetical protein C4K48_04095 [Candidatus Thorarchaeota archaeon]|nr:MAG: hypothetical protein C4K48_04095 [Candidatus Thorarchaeota archaeon]